MGLTPFKVGFELLLFGVNMILAFVLWIHARKNNGRDLALMSLSSLFMALGSLAFASYASASDLRNLGGHAFKIMAYAMLYQAIFIANMRLPFEALKASEKKNQDFRKIIKTIGTNLHNAILYQVRGMPNKRLQYMLVSESVERILGIKAEDIYSDPYAWTRLVLDEDMKLLIAAETRSREALVNFDVTVRMRRPDGEERRMHLLATPRRLKDGTMVWDGLATDVTERYEAEEARRKLEAELNQHQKIESIGNLASGIAHDFNNVLAAILGNTQMAIEDLKNGDQEEALVGLAQIRKSATRAKGLVNQILSFSRKELPSRSLQPVRSCIEESLALLRTTLPRNIVLDERFEDDSAHTMIDGTQIGQVVVNLCTNAWHAIGDKPGRIGIHTSRVQVDARSGPTSSLLPGQYVRIRVEDDGCGMDTATVQRLFEPFFTTKPIGVGTGLGMSVVHRIITSHDGAITVDSSPGGGTRFDCFLPIFEPTSGSVSEATQVGTAQVVGNGEKVIYVDDDPLMARMVERMLTRARYKVVVFKDPQLALDAIGQEPNGFDVLVTDYNMPELTGLQLIQSARAVREHLPVVLLSGFVSGRLLEVCREQGVSHVMEKQKSLDELCSAIESALEQSAKAAKDKLSLSLSPGGLVQPVGPGTKSTEMT